MSDEVPLIAFVPPEFHVPYIMNIEGICFDEGWLIAFSRTYPQEFEQYTRELQRRARSLGAEKPGRTESSLRRRR